MGKYGRFTFIYLIKHEEIDNLLFCNSLKTIYESAMKKASVLKNIEDKDDKQYNNGKLT